MLEISFAETNVFGLSQPDPFERALVTPLMKEERVGDTEVLAPDTFSLGNSARGISLYISPFFQANICI